jgi:predicted DNA-binding protein with PD1-like motif
VIVFESRRRRVFIGRIEAGERVVAALVRAAREHEVTTAWVTATGSLQSVELAFTDFERGGRTETRAFGGGLELLTLAGSLSSSGGELVVEANTHVARLTDNGVEVLGGHLVDAVAHSVELRIECMDDLGLRRERDDATGLDLWRGEAGAGEGAARRAPAASPVTSPAPGVSWAMAAQTSAERETAPAVDRRRPPPQGPSRSTAPLPFVPDPLPARKRPSDDDDSNTRTPERGDYVDHKQFGLCRVEKVGDDGGLVIRLETGRRKLIKLDVLDVLDPREDGGKRIFPLRPRRR